MKGIKLKKELKKVIDWFKKDCEINEKSIEIFRDLLRAKVTCMTHKTRITPRRLNSMIKHIDRKQLREHLMDYIDEELAKLKNEIPTDNKG